MPDKEKQQVITAIGELGRRVTTADVATKTGLPVLVVQKKLNEVASDVGGHMQVGSSGDIVYNFTPGFSNAYITKGIAAVLLLVGAKFMQVLFYIVRISFGIALIVSLLTIIVLMLLFALLMARGLGDDRDRNNSGGFDFLGGLGSGGFHFSFWDWMVLRDLLWWNSMSSRQRQPIYYDYNRPTIRTRARSNFLLNCFSFLFGDGDPNEGLEEKRWQLIAQVIKKNNNVLTAEQLAPYLGSDPKNEDAVLPVLVRFNGRPEVTANGNIVYVFESLQSIAADQRINPPAYLQEFPWKFTNVGEGELLPVYVVAGLNMFGAWTVWNMARHLHGVAATEFSFAILLTNVLCVYGTLFVAIPLVRHLINQTRNKQIDARNVQRFRYAQMVQTPEPALAAKLTEAKTFKVGDHKITQEEVVFSTDKDSRDQADELSEQFKKMGEEFDASP